MPLTTISSPLPDASATVRGAVSTGVQIFSGKKTFSTIAVAAGGGLDFLDASSLAVSAVGHGSLRYNNTALQFEQSVNGGVWAALSSGGGGGGGGGSVPAVYFDNALYAQAQGVTGTAGNYSTGATFAFDGAATITGVKWFQPGGFSASVKVTLWAPSTGGAATSLATVTVTAPTPGALNTASFATPYVVGAGTGRLSISVYDSSHQLLYANGLDVSAGSGPGVWGLDLYLYGFGYAAGDAGNLGVGGNYTGIIPLYSSSASSGSGGGGGGGTGLPAFATAGSAIFQVGSGAGATAIFRPITAADIQPNFAISSLSGGGGYVSRKESGDTVVNPSFTLAYVTGPPTSVSANDGLGVVAMSSPFTSKAYTQTYTVPALGTSISWTFIALNGAATSSSIISTTPIGRIFYGLATPGTYNDTTAHALATLLADSGAGSYSTGAGDGTKKYQIWVPAAQTQPSLITSGGFGVPFTVIATAVAVTNAFGAVANYNVIETQSFIVLNTPLQVS